MRKSLLLGCLLLLLALAPARAQQSKPAPTSTLPLDPVTQLITYKEAVRTTGFTQDTLFTRAQRWYRRQFMGQQQAPERGGGLAAPAATRQGLELIATGWEEQSIQLPAGGSYYRLHFVLQLFATEDGYTCLFNNFCLVPSDAPARDLSQLIPVETLRIYPGYTPEQQADLLAQIQRHVTTFSTRQLASLKEAMVAPIPGSYYDLHRND